MHVNHPKFVELLADACGITTDKVEKQLQELVNEISQALKDDEAYEIEGFGIFSGLGNRIMFIPSAELETEINFKYAGMEPIEMESATAQEEEEPDDQESADSDDYADYDDPFDGMNIREDDIPGKRDPFTGLVVDLDEDEIPDQTEKEDTASENDEDPDDILFGGDDPIGKEIDLSDHDDDDDFDLSDLDISDEEDEEEEPKPTSNDWGIDAHREDKSANRLLSSLMGDEIEEEEDSDEDDLDDLDSLVSIEDEEDSEVDVTDDEEEESETVSEATLAAGLVDELSDPFEEADEDDREEADDEEEDLSKLNLHSEIEDEFDDPFGEIEEEESKGIEDENKPEIMPVITNISSDLPEKPEKEPKKKPEKKKKEPKPPKEKKEQEPVSPLLLVVFVIVLLAGSAVGLAYFDVVKIPYLSGLFGHQTTVTQPAQPVVNPAPQQQTPAPAQEDETPTDETAGQTPEEDVTAAEADVPATPAENTTPAEQDITENEIISEPPAQSEVQTPVITGSSETVPSDQSKYGLYGVTDEAANDGYTIVVFSLSNQESAMNQQQKLSNDGYRAMVVTVPHSTYGMLYRVSIGQFATQVDAAIASDDLQPPYSENFFIKKITN